MKHFVNFKSVPSLAKKKLASVLTPMGLGKFEKKIDLWLAICTTFPDVKMFPTRYVPSGDLENIYLEYYGEKKINKDEIQLCSALMLLGWIGEKIAGAKLFSIFSKTSPFLMEDMHSYFQGMS